MVELCVETVSLGQIVDEGLGILHLDPHQFAAGAAGQVKVVTVHAQELVAPPPVVQFYPTHQFEFLKEFQGPVDGGYVHAGAMFLDAGVNLLGGSESLYLVHHREHHFSLRSEAEAALAEHFQKDLFTRHRRIPLLLLPTATKTTIAQ